MAQANTGAGSTVTVACKVPNGLLLRVGKWSERDVPVLGGGTRTEREWHPDPEKIKVHGPSRAPGEDPRAPISGGYALTPGVPADVWERWLEDNKDSPLVKNQMILAHAKQDHAGGMAADRKDLRSGLEPMKQDGDPRMPRQGNPNLPDGLTTMTKD